MKICGFEKFSLLDYPGKIACVIFLGGCNFRCGFCHNPELVLGKIKENFSEHEVLDFLEKRKGQIDGVCITGGEPLVNINIEFLKKVKELGYLIKLDTNGSFPDKLKELIDLGLVDYVAMDIKSSKEKYNEVSGSSIGIDKIEQSIRLISELENYEFRTTIVARYHDKEEIIKIADWLNKICNKKPKKFTLQGFKKEDKLLDHEFQHEPDTSEALLKEVKEAVKDSFDVVDVRV